MAVMNRSTAPHYVWGESCDGWRLGGADGLSVIEERMPPGTAETAHIHRAAHQVFYVLEGALTIEVDGETHLLEAFDALNVMADSVHLVRNETCGDARFLVISSPPTTGDRHAV